MDGKPNDRNKFAFWKKNSVSQCKKGKNVLVVLFLQTPNKGYCREGSTLATWWLLI